MDIGVCVASHINDVGYVVRAEELGFSHAWMADSQMLWSDCFATLALVADRTSRINIGTGVAISGTRPAPVNAAGIATINAMAPGISLVLATIWLRKSNFISTEIIPLSVFLTIDIQKLLPSLLE